MNEDEITNHLGHSELATILLVHLQFRARRGHSTVKQFVRGNVHQWQDRDLDQFDQDLRRDHNKVEDLDNQRVPAELAVPVVPAVVTRAVAELALLIARRALVVPVVLAVPVVLVVAVLLDEVEVVGRVVDQVAHPVVVVLLLAHSVKVRRNPRSPSQRKRDVKRSTIWRRQYSVA